MFPPSVWWTYFTEMMPVMAGRTIVNIDNQSVVADIVRLTLDHKQALTTYNTVAVSSLLRNGVALGGLAIIALAGQLGADDRLPFFRPARSAAVARSRAVAISSMRPRVRASR